MQAYSERYTRHTYICIKVLFFLKIILDFLNSLCWKAPLDINTLLKARPIAKSGPTPNCVGPYLAELWRSPRTELSQLVWAPAPTFDNLHCAFQYGRWIFLMAVSLHCHRDQTRLDSGKNPKVLVLKETTVSCRKFKPMKYFSTRQSHLSVLQPQTSFLPISLPPHDHKECHKSFYNATAHIPLWLHKRSSDMCYTATFLIFWCSRGALTSPLQEKTLPTAYTSLFHIRGEMEFDGSNRVGSIKWERRKGPV